MFRQKLLFAIAFGLAVTVVTQAEASSTIYDGVIEKVEGDKVWIRVAHSPYTSVPGHSRIMTHKDGTFQLEEHPLSDFATLYIDEVPVTKEQMQRVLRPGLRVVTMENRSIWYFLYVSTRSNKNHIGFLKSIKGNRLTLERPQLRTNSIGVYEREAGKTDSDGFVHLTFEKYPHRTTEVIIDDQAVVKANGVVRPWREATLVPDSQNDHVAPERDDDSSAEAGWSTPLRSYAAKILAGRNSILVQAPRDRMRVELVPPGYGDW